MSLLANKILNIWAKVTIARGKKKRSRRRIRNSSLSGRLTRASYLQHKERALVLVSQKILQFNADYNFKVGRVAIRNQRSRWGSCSRLGNLNFNYKIALLPEPLADYLVVHELCHLGEFNHSPRFWALVSRTIPDYQTRRRALKRAQVDIISI